MKHSACKVVDTRAKKTNSYIFKCAVKSQRTRFEATKNRAIGFEKPWMHPNGKSNTEKMHQQQPDYLIRGDDRVFGLSNTDCIYRKHQSSNQLSLPFFGLGVSVWVYLSVFDVFVLLSLFVLRTLFFFPAILSIVQLHRPNALKIHNEKSNIENP